MATPSIYNIPKSSADLARVVWVAAGLCVAVLLVGLIVAGQYAAWRFGYHPSLGQPVWPDPSGKGGLYAPGAIFVWIWKYFRPDVAAETRTVITQAIAMLAGFGIAGLLVAVTYIWHRTRKLKTEELHLHGSAGWASEQDIAKSGLLPSDANKGGCLVGSVVQEVRVPPRFAQQWRWWPQRLGWKRQRQIYLRHKGPEHILVFAPTRSGKGVGIVVPTLLSWNESVLVHDIKGENWSLTSGFREKVLGQRCLRFAPSEAESARFNPLAEIRRDGNIVKDVQNIATIIVDPDGKGLQDHWAKTGFDLLTGVILYVLLEDIPESERSLATVQSILSDGGIIRARAEAEQRHRDKDERSEGIKAVFEYIVARARTVLELQGDALPMWQRIGWQTAGQAAQSYLNKAPNEASGVLSTALSFLALYRDPIVAHNTSGSDFTIEGLMQEKTSLYLVVPPSDKDRLKPLLRLIINQVVRRLTESMEFEKTGASKTRYKHRLLLLIDEFPALGKLDVFEEALAFIAGYGLKAMLITQDLSQLQKAYTKDESIISNCHIRIAYAPNKVETAELLSKMTGVATVRHEQRNYSGSRLSILLNNVSTNEQIVQRPLLTADECMRLPPDDALIFVAGFKPIYGRKIKYYEDPALAKRQRLGPASAPVTTGATRGGAPSTPAAG
jgi:type IV secretion system protein VirD4